MRRGTLSLSWGAYGGFYVHLGFASRICLGWVALTYFPIEIEDLMRAYVERGE